MRHLLKKHILANLFPLFNRLNGINSEQTIFITGSPRSGTTWLAEIMSSIPDYKLINEPLNLNHTGNPAAYGFGWRTTIHPDNTGSDLQKMYFTRLVNGEIDDGSLRYYPHRSFPGRLRKHIAAQNLLIKCCRAGRLMHWLSRNVEHRGIVMIIRHPCAVISSMLRHGRWDDIKAAIPPETIPEPLREQCLDILGPNPTKVRSIAVNWCLDYYIPFFLHDSGDGYPWHLVSYEALLRDPQDELQKMFHYLDTDLLGEGEDEGAMEINIDRLISRKSSSSSDSLALDQTRRQLEKWQKHLTGHQIGEVLTVLNRFDMQFYGEKAEPDYETLNRFSGS